MCFDNHKNIQRHSMTGSVGGLVAKLAQAVDQAAALATGATTVQPRGERPMRCASDPGTALGAQICTFHCAIPVAQIGQVLGRR
jgi:hypothetical protein